MMIQNDWFCWILFSLIDEVGLEELYIEIELINFVEAKLNTKIKNF